MTSGRGLGAALAAPLQALHDTVDTPALARLQTAWALLMLGCWIHTVTLTVYAFGAGGAAAVGVAMVIRSVPSVLAGPALGALGDRFPRAAVMAASASAGALALLASAAIAATNGPEPLVYALALVVTVAAMGFRTGQSAILPALARGPRDLAAANVVTSTVESGAVFVGPTVAALLLAWFDPAAAFAAAGVMLTAAAGVTVGLRGGPKLRRGARGRGRTRLPELREPTVILVLALLLVQTVVSGALTVLYAVMAVDLLDMGAAGVGVLTAAYGAGGMAGSVAAFTLVGAPRIVAVMIAGLLLFGAPLLTLAVVGAPAAALLLLLIAGAGNVLFDVTAVTLLQRSVPDAVLARVFGALETVVALGLGLGAALAPLLVGWLGARSTLAVIGALLPAAVLATGTAIAAAAHKARLPAHELAVLRRVPLFAGLPGPVLENLAFHATPARLAAGDVLMRQGDTGDRYYAIASGQLNVSVDGVEVAQKGPGDGVGEIALLRAVPRIATVAAIEDAELLAIEREPFLAAVTGHAAALEDANAIVAGHMAGAALARRAA